MQVKAGFLVLLFLANGALTHLRIMTLKAPTLYRLRAPRLLQSSMCFQATTTQPGGTVLWKGAYVGDAFVEELASTWCPTSEKGDPIKPRVLNGKLDFDVGDPPNLFVRRIFLDLSLHAWQGGAMAGTSLGEA